MTVVALDALDACKRENDLISVASSQLNTMGVSTEWFGGIAAELGVTRPALYNYVRERDDLQFKCYMRSCDLLERAMLKASRAGCPQAVISAFMEAAVSRGSQEAAVLCEIDALAPEKQREVRIRRDEVISQIAASIEKGAREGTFREVDYAVAANAILGLVDWTALVRRWNASPSAALNAATLGDILFRGLARDRHTRLHKPPRFATPRSAIADPFDRQSIEAAKHERILVAASHLFNRKGVGATRVEDVAAHLELNKRTIYHLVGNKVSLVEACFDRAIEFYMNVHKAAVKSDCTRLEAMYGATRDVIEFQNTPDSAVLVLYVGFGQLSPAGRKKVMAFAQQITAGYERVLKAGVRDQSFRRVPYKQIVPALAGVFSWVPSVDVLSSDERAHIADELAKLTCFGLLA